MDQELYEATRSHWMGLHDLIDELVSQQEITPYAAAKLLKEIRFCRECDETFASLVLRSAQLKLQM